MSSSRQVTAAPVPAVAGPSAALAKDLMTYGPGSAQPDLYTPRQFPDPIGTPLKDDAEESEMDVD